MYIANTLEDQQDNTHVKNVQNLASKENSSCIVICAKIEAEIAQLDDESKKEFLAELNMEQPGLNIVIKKGYDLLNLETYFTAGKKEVRAWTYESGSKAPVAAGKIHTDFEKGFIRAEVISYNNFIECKSELKAKELGKMSLEGKDYTVKDGDIMHFRFNV